MAVRGARRSLVLLLALAAVLALTLACTGSGEDDRVAPAAATATAAPTSATPTAAATPAAPTPAPTSTATPTATPPPTATARPSTTSTPWPTSTATPSPAATAAPTALRYDRFDTTGAVATAGSYAFLMPDGQATSVVTTYEQLRTEATVMRVNVQDAHGASWGSFYDAGAVGDVVEWRQAEDCWIAYRVTEVLPDPPGVQPRKGFAVQWLAYAGTGCSGVIPARAAAHIDWAPRPPIQSSEVIAPVRFGAYVFGPENWRGELDPTVTYGRPAEFESDPPPIVTSDIEEAQGASLVERRSTTGGLDAAQGGVRNTGLPRRTDSLRTT